MKFSSSILKNRSILQVDDETRELINSSQMNDKVVNTPVVDVSIGEPSAAPMTSLISSLRKLQQSKEQPNLLQSQSKIENPTSSSAAVPAPLIEAGEAVIGENDLIDAMLTLEEAVISLDGLQPEKINELQECLSKLVGIYVALERPENAIAALNDLIIIDATLTTNPLTIKQYATIAALFTSAGKYDQAWELYWRALNQANDILSADDPMLQQLNDSYIELYKKSPSGKASREVEGLALLAKARSATSKNLIQREPLNTDSNETTCSVPKKDFKPSEIMQKRSKSSRNEFDARQLKFLRGSPFLSLVATFALLIVLAGLATNIYNEKIHPPAVLPAIDVQNTLFQSCDKHTNIKFQPSGECTIGKFGTQASVRYSTVTDSGKDILALLRGSMCRQELWYHCDQFGLKGSDRIRLYRDNAPELKIVGKMWWYAYYAQQYYKECKLYPIDSEKCRRADPAFEYLNPESLKPDYSSIILQKQTGEDMTASQPAARERHWKPFGIYCVCINYKRFIVHGFDRFGLPLTSSDANQYFVIKSRNGAAPTVSDLSAKLTNPQLVDATRSQHVVVTNCPQLEGRVEWLKRFVPAVLLLIFSVSLFCSYYTWKYRIGALFKFASYITSVAALFGLVIWFGYVFDSNFVLHTDLNERHGGRK